MGVGVQADCGKWGAIERESSCEFFGQMECFGRGASIATGHQFAAIPKPFMDHGCHALECAEVFPHLQRG